MIRAIIFDIDGVLLDSFEANLKFFQDLMIKAGFYPPTRNEFSTAFPLTMRDAIKTLIKTAPEENIEKIMEIGCGGQVGYDNRLVGMPEGVEEVIETLSKDYLLAIVTNRLQESIYRFPRLAKLEKYFKVVVSCEDTINHKPHPEPLLLAAKKLRVMPEECIYIGDAESDLKAARAAGMKIIMYSQEEFNQADASTSIFTKLPQLVSFLAKDA